MSRHRRPRADIADPLLRELLGAVLREERLRRGERLADVAAAAGVSVSHLSDLERGAKEPSSEVIRAVAAALGLPLATVLERGLLRLRWFGRTTATRPRLGDVAGARPAGGAAPPAAGAGGGVRLLAA